MKLRILIACVTAFLLVCGTGAFIAWCGGYNFDHRNMDVAFGVVATLLLAGGAVNIVRSIMKDQEP